jgi:hypothetical protein
VSVPGNVVAPVRCAAACQGASRETRSASAAAKPIAAAVRCVTFLRLWTPWSELGIPGIRSWPIAPSMRFVLPLQAFSQNAGIPMRPLPAVHLSYVMIAPL